MVFNCRDRACPVSTDFSTSTSTSINRKPPTANGLNKPNPNNFLSLNPQPTTGNGKGHALSLHLIPKKYRIHQQLIGSKPESAEIGVIGEQDYISTSHPRFSERNRVRDQFQVWCAYVTTKQRIGSILNWVVITR